MWLPLSLEVAAVVANEKTAVQNVEVEVEAEAVEVALVLLWNAERRMQDVVVGVVEEEEETKS